jgi:hypothetical protein
MGNAGQDIFLLSETGARSSVGLPDAEMEIQMLGAAPIFQG